MNKQSIIAQLINDEGGYVNHPDDPGGKTKYGITEKRARAFGYDGPMSKLTKTMAIKIYDSQDWSWTNGDKLLDISPEVAKILFTITVMSGPHTAGIILQQVMNALATYNLDMDGSIGPKTLAATRSYVSRRTDRVLVECLKARYIVFFIGLVETNAKRRTFIHGWVNRICK